MPCGIPDKEIVSYRIQLVLVGGRDEKKKNQSVVRKVKIVGHKREFMSCGSIKPAIVILALILMGSIFLQVSYSQGPNVTTSTTDPKYETARDQFLKVWDTLRFHPIVATFVNESAELGNGVYQEHSNVFNPDETINLYAQPIGFGHKEINGQNGEKLFLINFTADIILTTQDGTLIGGAQNIPAGQIASHYRNTELFLHLFLTHEKPLPKGDYKVNYSVTDQFSGNTFKITKDLKVV
ncbi:MAG: hypothetical protein WB975_10860 [Nitrososphaeraceae archaeon]